MQKEHFEAFKAYDIRAESPSVLDTDFASKLGIAISKAYAPKNVMIGWDMRTTSVELEKALVDSLLNQGVNVVRIGLCSTPMFNVLLGLAENKYDLGVMITASHNPAKYNGFKITRGDCLPLGLGTGLEKIRDAWPDENPFVLEGSSEKGNKSEDPNALDRYVDYVVGLANIPADMPDMKIVIDAGNGMGGYVLPKVLERCPWIKSENLYFELDGNFPNHEANPIKPETLNDLRAQVLESKAICGVAFDGDADRIGFVDEQGEQIRGDILTAFFANQILESKKQGLVLADIRSSWSVAEVVQDAGGKTEFCKVGHANIKQDMRNKEAVFAGEMSMHYYFQELWNVESGDYAMLLMLKALARSKRPLSSMWHDFVHYKHSGEINFQVKDTKDVLKNVQNKYQSKADKFFDIDGIRCEFGNPHQDQDAWWFSLRASNTEPLIRLNAEAVTEEKLKQKIEELKSFIV